MDNFCTPAHKAKRFVPETILALSRARGPLPAIVCVVIVSLGEDEIKLRGATQTSREGESHAQKANVVAVNYGEPVRGKPKVSSRRGRHPTVSDVGIAASIMASATPFCFCTTQKHLTVKRARSSRG